MHIVDLEFKPTKSIFDRYYVLLTIQKTNKKIHKLEKTATVSFDLN